MTLINLKGITKKYGDNTVLENYDLSVEKGDFVCITGKSGSGKSTLLNIIGLLETADKGVLDICGFKNPKISSRKGRELLRYKLAYLFQNYGLIEDQTVEKNILIATKYISDKSNLKDIIKKALLEVGLEGFEKKKIFQLSGGEQQRVALVKIMIKPCEIILADEPTGSLDPFNRELVLSIMGKLHKSGKTIILASHDEAVIRYAKRIEKLG